MVIVEDLVVSVHCAALSPGVLGFAMSGSSENQWKSIYSLQEEIFVFECFVQGASYVSLPVTKPVVTQGTTRYPMKGMDIIFPLIPCRFLWVK